MVRPEILEQVFQCAVRQGLGALLRYVRWVHSHHLGTEVPLTIGDFARGKPVIDFDTSIVHIYIYIEVKIY